MPSRKVGIGAFAGAIVGIGVWVSKAFAAVEVPAEVAVFMSTALVFGLQYVVRDAVE